MGIIRIEAALARSFGGKARKSIAVPTGVSMPPPTPWSTRKAMSDSRLQASPQASEALVKMTSAVMKIFFVPKRSPNQPEIGMTTARLSK